ncbi:TIGR01777 family protein [Rheinheimera sp. SA_1]|uniref:TIGR01777 family oxidoreductase n=1 Tax=Rheinheimera sp. SA_1 TaxID=1827365 RepID=UPI0007FF07A5|nr:TIGR01777 family oxidoreductase [Rheinheimera sp. SA_1]OBP14597.1 TIGR01777 family protein [Rheinheimera sp. SA_1]
MRILITGASGLIGSALVRLWQNQHQLIVLSRSVKKVQQQFGNTVQAVESFSEVDFNQLDMVVNLAGEPIANSRWTSTQKDRICQSRWQLTEQLVALIQQATTPPHTLINASAVGFYGRQSGDAIDENYQSYYPEFSHDICARWENLANRARSEQTRVCILRIGIVLAANGGALKKMLPPFKLGLGGVIGNGEQYMSWIHLDDLIAIFEFLLQHPALHGVFNATAPMAVSNKQWTKILAERLGKPALLPMPAFAVKLLFGEMSDLLLFGQNVYPQRLLDHGFTFKFSQFRAALQDLTL